MNDELWRVIAEAQSYEVSSFGRVRNTLTGKFVSQSPTTKGYWKCSIVLDSGQRKTCQVHTLVLRAFVGPCPQGMQSRHGKEGKLVNTLSNLCYGTPKENEQDKHLAGTYYGRRSTPIPAEVRDEVWRLTLDEVPAREIMSKCGISVNSVWRIRRQYRALHA